MGHPTRLVRRSLAFAVAVPFLAVHAQGRGNGSSPAASAAPTAAKDGGTLKVMNLEDYARFNRIGGMSLTADGKWMMYTLTPNEGGQPTLHIKPIDAGEEIVINIGGGGRAGGGGGGRGRGAAAGDGGGTGPTFSDDSKWVFYTAPNTAGRGAARGNAGGGGGGRGGRGNTPPGGRGAAAPAQEAAAPTTHLELRNLATNEVQRAFTGVASARFSPGSKYLLLRMSRPAGAPAGSTSADLVIHDLATGADRNIGNVNQSEFDDNGKLLAYTVDAPEKLGNGVFLFDPVKSETMTLTSGDAEFDALTWNDNNTGISVLRGDKPAGMKQKSNVLLAWTGIGAGSPKSFTFDPSKDASFPKGYVVSEFSAPRWSPDGSKLFIGIKEQEAEVAAADSNKANVDILHWKDQSPQTVQQVQIQQLRRATFPAVVLVNSGKFVRLGDDDMRTVTVAANNNVGIGRNDAQYRGEVAWGGSHGDIYKVDINTGARTLIEKGLSRTYGTSPDSKWFVYLKNKQLKAANLDNGTTTTLDASGVPNKNYINEDDDHAYELPIWGVAGWTRDGKAVLLYDKYDIWSAPFDGSKATNVTQGVGRSQQIQFRVTRFGGAGGGGRGGRGGRGGGGAAGDSDGVDMSKAITMTAYGTTSKKYGFWQVTPGQAPTQIIWADKNIGSVVKAADADRLLFTEQDYNEFPDYWLTNSAFASPKKMTDANPFVLKEYLWSPGKVLIDYKNSKGQALQGTLTLPAGYEKGKKYPMLVEFYEIMSNTHHNFPTPGYGDSPQIGMYASNGYIVFQPDIVYEIGKPGTSAVDCVTSAVKKVIELGYADPKHIGLHGHSWGGYQSSFIVTQTDIFAAVVTGAPPTNLTSFYDELYKSSGTVQQGITTVGQVRMGANVNPWDNTQMFLEQSPIFHVKNIKTPFMILQGGEDGAVDYVEGLQFFNAARQQGKQVIELSYPGQPHNLTDRDDQKDFGIRMKQFFDHYLMDKPMPEWMANGLPQVKKGGPIK